MTASSSNFVDWMKRVIGGDRLDDFPPLGQNSSQIPPRSSDLGGSAATKDRPSSAAAAPPRVSNLGDSSSILKNRFPSTDEAPPRASDLGGSASVVKESPLSGWNSLFTSADARLQFVAPIVKDGKKLVTISKSVFDQGFFRDDCLLGQFFGPPPKIVVIQSLTGKL